MINIPIILSPEAKQNLLRAIVNDEPFLFQFFIEDEKEETAKTKKSTPAEKTLADIRKAKRKKSKNMKKAQNEKWSKYATASKMVIVAAIRHPNITIKGIENLVDDMNEEFKDKLKDGHKINRSSISSTAYRLREAGIVSFGSDLKVSVVEEIPEHLRMPQ